MTHTPQPLLSEKGAGQRNETTLSYRDECFHAAFLRLELHTVDVVPLDESAASLAHHNAVRVSVTDEVVSQNGVTSSADVHAAPLVLFNYIICN